jgi:RNA ligase (TIGR02306 family)
MERKLVSIQRIDALNPIKGADFIEQATILGWSLVVKKGEFRVGDLCVFFEIDSLLPEVYWSEFMRSSGFRVRTKKMKGVLSQGLALPLSAVGLCCKYGYDVGDEYTVTLGVTKYEHPAPTSVDIAGPFPSFIPKTDETRIQSVPQILNELQDQEVYITVKLDGTSATYAKLDGKLYVCSRNNELKPTGNFYWQQADRNLFETQVGLPEGYAVQGEICGEGIQKNRLGLMGKQLFVFNVFDIKAGKFLDYKEFRSFCSRHLLATVPIEMTGKFDIKTVSELLDLAEGFYPGTENQREGIVIRPIIEQHSPTLGCRLSFKSISNKFLLKGGED